MGSRIGNRAVPAQPQPAARTVAPPDRRIGHPAAATRAVATHPGAERLGPAAVPAGSGHGPGNRAGHRGHGGWEARYLRRLVIADLAVGLVAGLAAFGLRFGPQPTPYNQAYVALSALLPLAFVAALAANRGYDRRYLFVGTEEYQRVLRAGMVLTATCAVVAYALEVRLARGYVLIAVPLATVACLMVRFAVRKRLHRARRYGACTRRVIVVGHEYAVAEVTRQLRREHYHGFQVVGACLARHRAGTRAGRRGGLIGDVPVYGALDGVAAAVRSAAADTVIVLSCPELDGYALRRLAWQLERDDVDLIVASALLDVAGARTTIRPVDGLPMLHVEHPSLSGARRLVKAAFDRTGAVLLILGLSPLLAAVALAVCADSAGPVLFRQIRVGKDGRTFPMVKFRTMYVNAEDRLAELRHRNEYDGVLFKMHNDPRVTRVGRWLRRLSLDELPQLFNVLGGTMSLVGPRPPLPAEVAVYPADMHRRLAVRPGMTGLWQVSGRSDLPWEEAVRLDLRYVENWTLSLDLVILLRTVTAVWRGAGAY